MTFTSKVNVTDNGNPNYNNALTLGKGAKIISNSDSTIIFETLDIVDFTISSSNDPIPVVSNIDVNTGVATEYKLTRKVRAISGETKTATYQIGTPERFKKIMLPETNVIEVLKVVDSNNNTWYEVEYLAQDKVPRETFYRDDSTRMDTYGAYSSFYDSIEGSKVDPPNDFKFTLNFQGTQRGVTYISAISAGVGPPDFSDNLDSLVGFFILNSESDIYIRWDLLPPS